MNADDILTAARERLAEIDAQIATLAAERETVPVVVPSLTPIPPLDWGPQSPDSFVVFRTSSSGTSISAPATLTYG